MVELVDLEQSRLGNPFLGCLMPLVGQVMGLCGTPWKPSPGRAVYKSSKAIGEPPLLLSSAVHSALRAAVTAARGKPLEEHLLPVPANSKAVLPLLEAVMPGANDDASTATPSDD